MRVLHLDDSASDALIIERRLQKDGIETLAARSREEFLRALESRDFDAVIVDNSMPRIDVSEAISLARSRHARTPVIVCSGAARDADVTAALDAGASEYVLKDHLWQLTAALRRAAERRATASTDRRAAMPRLIEVVQELSLARGLDAIVEIVRHAARELTGADGATFVLRDDDKCFYVDEDAISPLWKGQRFPLEACISGWAMLNSRSTIVPDIFCDPRIPIDAYRPTFVRSLVMVPIRTKDPVGAIGNYWATPHECTAEELELLEALANTTAVAIENVNVYADLERQVKVRTRELEIANEELEAFSSAVSHDLRAPLRAMNAELELVRDRHDLSGSIDRLQSHTQRMGNLIDDLLRLSRLSRAELRLESVDLAAGVQDAIARMSSAEPERRFEADVAACPLIEADPGLIAVVIENLVSNAWKYSSKQPVTRIGFHNFVDESGRRTFCISDNGAGFDPRYADRLFKPFSRLHGDQEFPGVGLGLATVHRIVQRHGGEVSAHSTPGAGTRVCFTLGNP